MKRAKTSKPARAPRSGKFEDASLVNDPELREYIGKVVSAYDLLIPLFEALAVSYGKARNFEAASGSTLLLRALTQLRATITQQAIDEGVTFAISPLAASVYKEVAALEQATARQQLASRSAISHANVGPVK